VLKILVLPQNFPQMGDVSLEFCIFGGRKFVERKKIILQAVGIAAMPFPTMLLHSCLLWI